MLEANLALTLSQPRRKFYPPSRERLAHLAGQMPVLVDPDIGFHPFVVVGVSRSPCGQDARTRKKLGVPALLYLAFSS